jgi:Carboxypeptidase regulatory-like domain
MGRLKFLVCVLLIAPRATVGCSVRSYEPQPVQPDFLVVVTHRAKPIPGVEVVVTPSPGASAFLTVSTDEKGTAVVHGLPPGRYWLAASYRGIEAGRELIEVSSKARKPKTQFDFRWADYSYETRAVSGKLTGLMKGNSGQPLQDVIHPVEVVHPGVPIKLRGAFSDEEYQTTSDSSGTFLFDPLPPGTYILTIVGGTKSFNGRTADSTTLVIDTTAAAKRDFLSLQLQDGGCGETAYELQTEK